MERFDRAWLVVNSASGSNTPEALDDLRDCLCNHAIAAVRTTGFPDEELPSPAALEAAGVPLVIIYAGDGTVNAAVRALAGWPGALLVLPGGTKNLLSKRLHGDYQHTDIVALVQHGGALRRRINVVRCEQGEALGGLLAGPGARWGEVREAMRELDLSAVASGAAEALAEMTGAAMVRCVRPDLGARDGYPLIEMTPGEHGVQLDAFHAETAGEFAAQGLAILRRNFHDGPHDRLGVVERVSIETVDGSPLELLLDGEAATGGPRVEFAVASCEVDLLATAHGN